MSEIYRDGTEGAAAKRQELLRRRRDELVTMPHAVRRVVVARSARIAGGVAVTLAGIALLGAAATPKVATWMTSWLPGIQPAPLSTLLSTAWIFGLVAWAIGRARVEHRFAVEMSRYVLPGSDLDHDIERLDHEHPDEIARQKAHHLEVQSSAWPVVAAALILPATALYLTRAARTHGWPVMSEFEAALAMHSGALIAIAIGGAIGAIAMTRRTLRLPIAAPIAGGLGFIAGLVAIGLVARGSAAALWVSGIAVVFGTIGFLGRRLRVERVLIAAEDPAAGSEMFTIRGFIRSVRTTSATAVRAVRNLRGYKVLRVGVVGAIAAGLVAVTMSHKSSAAPPAVVNKAGSVMPHPISDNPRPMLDPSYKIERVGSRFKIDLVLADGSPINIPSLSDLGMVPPDWHATLSIELGSTDASLAISPFESTAAPMNLDAVTNHVEFQIDNCDGRVQPLGLHAMLRTKETGPKKVTLYVTPTLGVAHCDQ